MQPDLFASLAEHFRPPSYAAGTAAGAARTSETSQAAAASLQPTLGARQAAVLRVIREQRGATCSEIARTLALPMHSCSGRLTELRMLGKIHDTGQKRAGPSGRLGTVWHARRAT
jgi:predicted transcriptional regulator